MWLKRQNDSSRRHHVTSITYTLCRSSPTI